MNRLASLIYLAQTLLGHDFVRFVAATLGPMSNAIAYSEGGAIRVSLNGVAWLLAVGCRRCDSHVRTCAVEWCHARNPMMKLRALIQCVKELYEAGKF